MSTETEPLRDHVDQTIASMKLSYPVVADVPVERWRFEHVARRWQIEIQPGEWKYASDVTKDDIAPEPEPLRDRQGRTIAKKKEIVTALADVPESLWRLNSVCIWEVETKDGWQPAYRFELGDDGLLYNPPEDIDPQVEATTAALDAVEKTMSLLDDSEDAKAVLDAAEKAMATEKTSTPAAQTNRLGVTLLETVSPLLDRLFRLGQDGLWEVSLRGDWIEIGPVTNTMSPFRFTDKAPEPEPCECCQADSSDGVAAAAEEAMCDPVVAHDYGHDAEVQDWVQESLEKLASLQPCLAPSRIHRTLNEVEHILMKIENAHDKC